MMQSRQNIIKEHLGSALIQWREEAGLSIDEVVRRLDLESSDRLRFYETGLIPVCELAKLTELYRVSHDRVQQVMLDLQLELMSQSRTT